MNYSINIINWFAIAPGLDSHQQWQRWAEQDSSTFSGDIPKYQHIPMMTARRMSPPTRLAVESGLQLLQSSAPQPIDAAVFISRHGELERTYKIITNLAQQADISPTDFAMSVHNTAAGLFTITAKQALPITSLAAGIDGFQQGMLEAQAMLASGAKRILIIDFDGLVPDAYHSAISNSATDLCYAVGLVITAGSQLRCQQLRDHLPNSQQINDDKTSVTNQLPQSLLFLKNWLNGTSQFAIKGMRSHWQWHI